MSDGACVYIVECVDHSFYTGLTRQEVETRVSEHNNGKYEGYTFKRRPVRLVYSAHFERIDEAISWERWLKGWSRAKKCALIRGDFDALPELAKCRATVRREMLKATELPKADVERPSS